MSKFTDKQQSVVDFNEGNIVVSASAGSGKTSVMIARIIRLIIEGRASINEILAVTFTKLAAKEIKDKISKAIIEKIKNNDENKENLKKQLDNLALASVSTVDSFCSNLLKTYFYAVDIDPQFGIVEDSDAKNLSKKALNEVFETLYEQNDSELMELLNIFVSKGSDYKLRQIVLDVYGYAISEKDYNEYFEKSINAYNEQSLKMLNNRLIDAFRRAINDYAQSINDLSCVAEKNGVEVYKDFFIKYSEVLYAIAAQTDSDSLVKGLKGYKLTLPGIKEANKTPVIIELSNQFQKFKKSIDSFKKKFYSIFSVPLEERIQDSIPSKGILSKIIRLVKLYDEKFTKMKRENNVLDYNDLEHLTLKLLEDDAICKEISSTYKFIFVDEYQDTNGVQEAIFSKISNNNLFIVGDIKQSIYSFRGCNPNIFKSKIQACSNGYGTHVDFDENFRSTLAVINATNSVFSAVMNENNAGLDYSSAKMIGGRFYGDYQGEAKLNVYRVDKTKESKYNEVYSIKKHLQTLSSNKALGEEKSVVDIILDQLNSELYDSKTSTRYKASFGDIAVLTRNNKGVGDRIVAELIKFGIPVVSQSKRSIGEYPDIKLLVNLVEYLCNPTLDIPLAAVMHSAFGNFSNDELAKIRQYNLKSSFYEACKQCIENEKASSENCNELAEKLIEFFDYFEKIRLISQFETAGVVLRKVIVERGFEIRLLSEKLGEIRMDRVNRFVQSAKDLTITEFNEKMQTLLDSMTLAVCGGDKAVRIMSYHASKGLEFPIVILVNASKPFNTTDTKNELVFDRNLGIGLKNYNLKTKVAKTTIVREAIKNSLSLGVATDEMRLLYVAMTRAECKLFITSEKSLFSLHRYENYVYASKMTDFLSCEDLEEYVPKQSLKNVLQEERREFIISKPNDDDLNKITKFLNYRYPYQSDTKLSLKKSVTEVVKDFSIGLDFNDEVYQPEVLYKGDKREVGTSYHRFLETCNFNCDVESEFERLKSQGFLSLEQAQMLDKSALNNILGMDIIKRISSLKLYREQPFILNAPSNLVCEIDSSEEVLIQGVIDLLAIGEDGAYILDYKFSSKSKQALMATYAKQLQLYSFAVKKIMNIKILGCYLVNLQTCESIELKDFEN